MSPLNASVRGLPHYTCLTSFEKRHNVTPRPDAGASVVKYRNASELKAAGFRVKRGMTINRRFLKKLNEYMLTLYSRVSTASAFRFFSRNMRYTHIST